MKRCIFAVGLLAACASTPTSEPAAEPPPPPRAPSLSPERALERAAAKARAGDLAAAIDDCRLALEGDPKLEKAYLLLGSSCEQIGDVECAMGAYQRGLEALPRSPDLLRERGLLQLQNGEAAGAIADLDKALELKPSAETRSDLAFAHLIAGDAERAQQLSAEAVESEPGCFLCWMARAEILTRIERHADAIAAYEQALQLEPDPDAKAGLAKAKFRAGDIEGAHTLFEELVESSPDDLRLRVQAAQAALKAGDAARAVVHLRPVLRAAPEDRQLLQFMLQAQQQAKDAEGAAETKAKLKALGG